MALGLGGIVERRAGAMRVDDNQFLPASRPRRRTPGVIAANAALPSGMRLREMMPVNGRGVAGDFAEDFRAAPPGAGQCFQARASPLLRPPPDHHGSCRTDGRRWARRIARRRNRRKPTGLKHHSRPAKAFLPRPARSRFPGHGRWRKRPKRRRWKSMLHRPTQGPSASSTIRPCECA